MHTCGAKEAFGAASPQLHHVGTILGSHHSSVPPAHCSPLLAADSPVGMQSTHPQQLAAAPLGTWHSATVSVHAHAAAAAAPACLHRGCTWPDMTHSSMLPAGQCLPLLTADGAGAVQGPQPQPQPAAHGLPPAVAPLPAMAPVAGHTAQVRPLVILHAEAGSAAASPSFIAEALCLACMPSESYLLGTLAIPGS